MACKDSFLPFSAFIHPQKRGYENKIQGGSPMKKIVSLFLAAMMLLSCVSALAEIEITTERKKSP
ncbi:MAG: hypothetical protein E7333_03720 [Clostridiales bacterium]|nr:hypothetical protein [Clostridiales bacterium]